MGWWGPELVKTLFMRSMLLPEAFMRPPWKRRSMFIFRFPASVVLGRMTPRSRGGSSAGGSGALGLAFGSFNSASFWAPIGSTFANHSFSPLS